MSNVTRSDPRDTVRKRKMVPRVHAENDHEVSADDILSDHSDVFDAADFNKNNKSTVINNLKSKTFDSNELRVWEYENDGLSNENESHQSLLEEQVIIPETKETMLSVALQVFVPFLIAGFGTVGAGLVLDIVQASILFCCLYFSYFI